MCTLITATVCLCCKYCTPMTTCWCFAMTVYFMSLLFQLRGIAIYVSVNQYFDFLYTSILWLCCEPVLWLHELFIPGWHRFLYICKSERWPVMLEFSVSAARHRHLCFCETGLWPVMLELTISAARHRYLCICKPELSPVMLELTVSAARHRHLCICEPVLWLSGDADHPRQLRLSRYDRAHQWGWVSFLYNNCNFIYKVS